MFVVQYVIGNLEISVTKRSGQSFLSGWVLRNCFPTKGRNPLDTYLGQHSACVLGMCLGHRQNVVRCHRVLNSGMMSRDFISENSSLGRYPGWHTGEIEIVDSIRGPQNTRRWPTHQCQSSSCLFPVCEGIESSGISTGIESSYLETCLSSRTVWDLLYKTTVNIQRWGDVGLGCG